MGGSENKVHVYADVAKHNTKGDCWLLVHGKVYNVTDFLDDHPGGDEVIINSAGKDATDDFEDVGHSDDARDQMKQYYVGELDKSSLPSEGEIKGALAAAGGGATSTTGNQNNSGGLIKILQYLIPLLILGVAFAYRLLNNNNVNKEE